MKRAEYPERTCREPVFGEYLTYNCELAEHSTGPCVSFSVPASVKTRETWERAEAARAAEEAGRLTAKPRASRGRRRKSDA